MVSTRGPKTPRYFEKGEKVLCYEPDPTKAKVLYDSKILGVHETKDRRGRRILQYKVHFQGWSSSWDRKVNADFVLKDSEENRQLQRDLAEKAQLHLGSYLYRRDRNRAKKQRDRKLLCSGVYAELQEYVGESGGSAVSASVVSSTASYEQLRGLRGSSEDNFSSSSNTEKLDDYAMRDDCDTDSYCSSVESLHDEERVRLRISQRLRQFMEYDHDMIVKYGRQHTLPSRVPVLAILEYFVKLNAVKLVASTQPESTRRRSQKRTDKKEKELEKIASNVALLKEVVDGLRIYFDFTVADYLLYREEKEHVLWYLTDEHLKDFRYEPLPGLSPDFLNQRCDIEQALFRLGSGSSPAAGGEVFGVTVGLATPPGARLSCGYSGGGGYGGGGSLGYGMADDPQKRKLRSHRPDEASSEAMLENCFSSFASTSSSGSTPLYLNVNTVSKPSLPLSCSMSPQARDFLQEILAWQLLPLTARPLPSMLFGAPHLSRLLVKLPDFLNASLINDDKLKLLLQHLDSFINFLEAHREWFNESNYLRSFTTQRITTKLGLGYLLKRSQSIDHAHAHAPTHSYY